MRTPEPLLYHVMRLTPISSLACWQVADVFPLHLAAHKSLVAEFRGSLVTKSLHTELVYNLSSTKHVRRLLF